MVFGVYGHLPPVMKIGLLATLAEMCRMGLPMEDYTCAICKLYINAVCKQPNRNTGQAASFPVCAKQRGVECWLNDFPGCPPTWISFLVPDNVPLCLCPYDPLQCRIHSPKICLLCPEHIGNTRELTV